MQPVDISYKSAPAEVQTQNPIILEPLNAITIIMKMALMMTITALMIIICTTMMTMILLFIPIF